MTIVNFDARIRELDLTPGCYQLAVVCGWDLTRIRAAESEYRGFLQLILIDSRTAHAPTADADEFWHQHILCTNLYTRDCERLFGTYLHHYPFSGRFGVDDLRLQTQRIEQSRSRLTGIIREEPASSAVQQPGELV